MYPQSLGIEDDLPSHSLTLAFTCVEPDYSVDFTSFWGFKHFLHSKKHPSPSPSASILPCIALRNTFDRLISLHTFP
jgi:hypothetical protein